MTTGLKAGKAANIFRGRLALLHDISAIYRPSISRNKEKLIELIREKAETAANSGFARKMRILKGFYTLEVAPPTKSEIAKLNKDIQLVLEFMKTKCYNFMTVRQAWLLFLVCTEVFLWFFIGETIGKGHIVGYLMSN